MARENKRGPGVGLRKRGFPELRSETARARGAVEADRRAAGTAKGDKARHLLWLVEADGSRSRGAKRRQAVREAAKQDKGRRPAPEARAGGAKQGRNFPVAALNNGLSCIKAFAVNFCAAGSGMFIPPPAPRRLVEPAQKPEGLWSGQ